MQADQQEQIRGIEKDLMVEKARIAQEEGVMLRDIERELVVSDGTLRSRATGPTARD